MFPTGGENERMEKKSNLLRSVKFDTPDVNERLARDVVGVVCLYGKGRCLILIL